MNITEYRITDYVDNDNNLDLDKIIDDYTPYIKTIIYNMAKDYLSIEDKEEILSDTFFILWKNKSNKILKLDAYLAGITRNLIREKFRKKTITYDISDFESVIKYEDNIEMFLEKQELLNDLKISYKFLNETDFKIIKMYYYSCKTIKDIASELCLSESNVKIRLHRVRKKLKRYLMKGGF